MVKYTFKKEERLCNKRFLNDLFQSGSSFILYPYKVSFTKSTHLLPFPAQVVISVPKRRFKKATDRNLIKRRMREAYRLQKQVLLYAFLSVVQEQLLISIQYIGKEIHTYTFMYDRLERALLKFQHEYRQRYMERN